MKPREWGHTAISAASVAMLTCAMSVAVVGASTSAAHATMNACAPNGGTAVVAVSNSWTPLGPAAGKYNASGSTETLSVSVSRTTTKSTTVETGAKMSVSWGIATVEAHVNVNITRSTTLTSSTTDTMNVPEHNYGYAQQKAQITRYHIYDYSTTPQCANVVTTDYGYLDAITAYPFFSECHATSPCTPQP